MLEFTEVVLTMLQGMMAVWCRDGGSGAAANAVTIMKVRGTGLWWQCP
jgi:hypothetical protein